MTDSFLFPLPKPSENLIKHVKRLGVDSIDCIGFYNAYVLLNHALAYAEDVTSKVQTTTNIALRNELRKATAEARYLWIESHPPC